VAASTAEANTGGTQDEASSKLSSSSCRRALLSHTIARSGQDYNGYCIADAIRTLNVVPLSHKTLGHIRAAYLLLRVSAGATRRRFAHREAECGLGLWKVGSLMSYQGHDEQVIYQIRVRGVIDARWSDWFAGLTLCPQADGDTLLTGPVRDQSALHGLLAKIRDLGLPLLSIERI
jgi:hypothetical protein